MTGESTGPDLESWASSVAAVLAKTARKDPSDMPADAWRTLIDETVEGLEINPLYTRADELGERPAPGEFPFVRGGAVGSRPEGAWYVAAEVDATGRAADANTEILGLLEDGVSSLWLRAGAGELATALDGVYLDLAPVVIDGGADAAELARAFLALLDERRAAGDGVTDRADVVADLGFDPLTAGFAGREAAGGSSSLDTAVQLARDVSGREESIRTFVADGTAFHDAGAGDVQEVAYATAAGVSYVRTLMEAGLSAADALGQISFRYAATDDQFQTIAKLRAARLVWARVAEALGAPDAGDAPQHAITSAPMMTRRDPWVNMLRTTLAAFGAGIGGATSVTVREFDSSIPDGLDGTSRGFARRIARNTQLLLIEESHLGHVADPAGGSWYVESLTETIAAEAWSLFQTVEGGGGLAAAIDDGSVAAAIETVAATRGDRVARRDLALTGLSEFPNLDEPALSAEQRGRAADQYRYGAAFEELRDRSDAHLEATGSRPTVLLAGLGPLAEISGRSTFVTNLLAAGGIAVRNPGTVTTDDIAGAVDGDEVAVLCGADKRYGTEGPAAVRALRGAGATRVYLAGAEKGFPAEASGPERADGYLALGIDAVAALTGLLDELGVK